MSLAIGQDIKKQLESLKKLERKKNVLRNKSNCEDKCITKETLKLELNIKNSGKNRPEPEEKQIHPRTHTSAQYLPLHTYTRTRPLTHT